ncbi:MAG: hypothetical protein NTX76_00845 [Alphaproteobacteria bacterium]|nr:hypothetical protein [Alphaproteobacteria bacterium]
MQDADHKVIPLAIHKRPPFGTNQYGEIIPPREMPHPNQKSSWQYRFFKAMVIFLLIVLLLGGLL